MAIMPAVLREWALEPRDMSVLASLVYFLLDTDYHKGADFPDWVGLCPMDVVERKSVWIGDWENNARAGLVALISDDRPKFYSDTMPEFEAALEALRTPGNRFRAGLLLVELAAIEGYWPKVTGDDYYKGIYISPEIRIGVLRTVAEKLGFPASFGEDLRTFLEDRVRELSRRVGLADSREFEGWKQSMLTLGFSAPFWRGRLSANLGSGGSTTSSKKDLIPWSLSHLSSGMVLAGDVGLPGIDKIFGAGCGLVLAPGLKQFLPPIPLLQQETILCAGAKYLVFMNDVLRRIGEETIARTELVELLHRTRDWYCSSVRDNVRYIGNLLSAQYVGNVFDALIEMSSTSATS
ncbi:hypothetical protein KBA41_11360 [Candidatus Ozemobacteraceae bacterium]|nr:hypothetical protein [Candidatus Ozemobacteraceae bacterium]